uniref:MABP domain-containing protein n=1 Tax=Meloidogyne javanica TaxID=6303 RepID=A0A915MQN9_MELJA
FIVAGLNDKENCDEFPAHSSDGKLNNGEAKAPITDICVVISSAGETTPVDFERIETTPSGYLANLNHGSIRSTACFVCFKRGYHKPPLIDLGILDESRGEKPCSVSCF